MPLWAIFHEIDKQFLLRYQKQVLSLVNSWFGRWFFDLKWHPVDRKFALVLPNAVGWWRDDGQFQLEFLSDDFYTDQLRKLKSVLQLIPLALIPSLETRAAVYAVPLLAGSVRTYNPSASYITGYSTMDPGGSNTWASLVGGAGTSSVVGTPDVRWNSQSGVNVWSFIRRSHFFFNTADIGSGSTISAATFEVYFNSPITAPSDTTNLRDLHIVSSTVSTNTTLASTDFAQVGGTSFGSIAYGSLATLAYNLITLDASGQANISKTGVSRFALRTYADLTNTAPAHNGTNNDVLAYRMQGYADANKPKLNVTLSVIAVTLTETMTLTDATPAKSTTRTLAETLTLTDVQSNFRGVAKTCTEVLTLTDSKIQSLSRTLIETLTLTSTALKTPQKILVETITFTETILRGFTKVLSETISFVDTVTTYFWRRRTKPSTSWTDRTEPGDTWTDRTKPPTTWS